MLMKSIGATTHIDRHNSRFTKEALESAADSINNSGRVPQVGLNHDKTIMPFGKVINAEVTLRTDGEYQLEMTQEVFEEEFVIKFKDGTKFMENSSSFDARPFSEEFDEYSTTSVNFDRVNFESCEDLEHLMDVIDEYNVESGIIARKSLIPDPELVIQVGNSIVGILLCKKIVDSVGDRLLNNLLDEVDNFYKMTRSVVVKYSKMVIPKNRPQTYVFNLKDEFVIELVVVTTSADVVMKAIDKENLIVVKDKAEELKKHFSINRLQFLYNEDKWEFNYLCTDKGSVIGTEQSYNRRIKAFELFREESEKLKNLEDGQS